MPLYTHLDRVEKGLAALGIGAGESIQPEQLFPLDQWHYQGTEAVRRAAEYLRLRTASRVLDIGSGIGGPARFLAHTTGCHVTALELQSDLHNLAANLTERCGLANRITHLCGDALNHPIPESAFDAVVSWLAVHHIPDRPRLCARIAQALRPGAGCYIEDLYMRAPFSHDDLRDVRNILVGNAVTSIDQCTTDLRVAGFIDIRAADLTSETKPFVSSRLAAWRQNSATYTHEYGVNAYAALDDFYATVTRLFDNGSLGCVALVANRN
jgi:cyclopropane fatty-acyl-phospholipid synthase-like methyltransferase